MKALPIEKPMADNDYSRRSQASGSAKFSTVEKVGIGESVRNPHAGEPTGQAASVESGSALVPTKSLEATNRFRGAFVVRDDRNGERRSVKWRNSIQIRFAIDRDLSARTSRQPGKARRRYAMVARTSPRGRTLGTDIKDACRRSFAARGAGDDAHDPETSGRQRAIGLWLDSSQDPRSGRF